MKVWVVERGYDYEGYDVQGIYTTEWLAMLRIVEEAGKGSPGKWRHYEADLHDRATPVQSEDK